MEPPHHQPSTARGLLFLSCGLLFSMKLAQAFLSPFTNKVASSHHQVCHHHQPQPLVVLKARSGRGHRGGADDREGPSKRQLRVGSLLQSEIADIIRKGYEVKAEDYLEDELRTRISVVDVECSPDIRHAKVAVSIYGETVDKREAFVWLVENAKSIRYALSQRLKDMRHVPEISFRQDDLSAGADMFHLLSQLEEDRKIRTMMRPQVEELEVSWSDDEEDGEEDVSFEEDDDDDDDWEEEETVIVDKRRHSMDSLDDDDDEDDLWEDDDLEDEEEDEDEEEELKGALGRRPGRQFSNDASSVFAKVVGRSQSRRSRDDYGEDSLALSPFEASLKPGSLEQELAREINAMKAAGIHEFDWSDDEDDEDEEDFVAKKPVIKIARPKKTPAKPKTAAPAKAKAPPQPEGKKGSTSKKANPTKVTRKGYREGKFG